MSQFDITWVYALQRILLGSRPWHKREQINAELHPAIEYLITQGHVPAQWQLLTLQHPHRADKDSAMLAYTQSDAKGQADIQTTTKPGRYIKRHFPQLSDDVIRDVVSLTTNKFEIWTEARDIVRAAQQGPYSCMAWQHADVDDGDVHPYQAYDPAFGWAVAVEVKGDGEVTGRALVNRKNMEFVRTYQGSKDSGNSSDHHALASWLEAQGYNHVDGWCPGTKLARIDYKYGFLAPYIDGVNQDVDDGGSYLRITANGEYTCNNTDGTPDEDNRTTWTCSECEEGQTDDDDQNPVGRHGDEDVCNHCLNRHFTFVRGADRCGGYREYYVRDSEVVEVNHYNYDANYLPDCIVTLDDGSGGYADEDDVTIVAGSNYLTEDCVELYDGSYTHDDEGTAVELSEHSAEEGWALEDDCVKTCDGWVLSTEVTECAFLGEDVPDSRITELEIDGETYDVHVDHVEALRAKLIAEAVAENNLALEF